MNRMLRVNGTDERIVYAPRVAPKVDQVINVIVESFDHYFFFFMFRGTSIKMYGRAPSGTGNITLILDGNPTTPIQFNSTYSADQPELMYHSGTIQDGDHQLLGLLSDPEEPFQLDHFWIDSSSGGSSDPLNSGPTAQSVPTHALIVNNDSPEITFHNETGLRHIINDVRNYKGDISVLRTKGELLSYSFDGVAIWYYGRSCSVCGSFTVSINGSTPERMNTSRSVDLDQQMIWYNKSLGTGRHTVTITHDDDRPIALLYLDFFRVLPGEGSSTLSSTLLSSTLPSPTPLSPAPLSPSSTTSFGDSPTDVLLSSPTNQNQTNKIPLAVGLTLGLLALIVSVVLGSVCYRYRRRRATPNHLDAQSVFPYTVSPMRQAQHQSGLPQTSKRSPEPAQPFGSPMATDNPAMSLIGNEFGPPPSYESPIHDWEVGVAQ